MPARSAKELANENMKSAGDHAMKGPSRAGPTVTPSPVGGGRGTDLGRERDGVDNAEQRQLDQEAAAAVGRQERTGLPDKPDAGGGAKMEKGTSLGDSGVSGTDPGKSTTPSSSQHH
jgi:hypothetical protein